MTSPTLICLLFLMNTYGRKPKCEQEAITRTDLDFWGNQYVTIDDKVMLSETFGYASALRGIKHSLSSKYPIISISKLFTSVSIWQLHEQGILDINTPISQYLDSSDFVKIGYDDSNNPGIYCPKLLNSDICQDITLNNLLSMNSGIVAVHGSICPYNTSSPFAMYCQNLCNDIFFQPYQGSIGYYMQSWINAPLTFIPGDGITYEYSNANYVFAGYLLEKLTGLSYRKYVEENIFIPLDLKNTYYDPFDGQLGINADRVRAHLLFIDENTMENIGIGECENDFQLGFWNAAAGLVSTNEDIHTFYKVLFDKRNQPSILFQNAETIKLLLYPKVLVQDAAENFFSEDLYWAHGVRVKIDENDAQNNDNKWPEFIDMSGRNACTRGRIRLAYLEGDKQLIVSVLSNAPRIYTNEQFMELMRYGTGDIPSQICHMLPGLDFQTGLQEMTELFEKYSGISYGDNLLFDGDNLCKKKDRDKIRKLNRKYKTVRSDTIDRVKAKSDLVKFVGDGGGIDGDLITITVTLLELCVFVIIGVVLVFIIVMISCWIGMNKQEYRLGKYAKVDVSISHEDI